jgi:RNA polymerase sigma-70 factor (TIGR02960 family)
VSDDAPVRAAAGDAEAFARVTAPHRRELLLHCYRLLGSLTDAEDQLQETLLAAWRGLDRFEGEPGQLRAWLYRIATNRCLNARRDAARRPAEPTPPFPPPEPTRRGDVAWLQPYPDALLPDAWAERRETIELAFVVALQRMPPRQAAVLVLRDVLGFAGEEVAAMLGTSATAVKGALQRARAAARDPVRDAGPGGVRPAPDGGGAIAARFAAALAADDVDGVVALLTDDAWLAMPPAPHEYHGPVAVAGFLRASAGWRPGRRARLVPTCANGQPAFGWYLDTRGGGVARGAGVVVVTLAGERVRGITRFLDPGLLDRFGLARELPVPART